MASPLLLWLDPAEHGALAALARESGLSRSRAAGRLLTGSGPLRPTTPPTKPAAWLEALDWLLNHLPGTLLWRVRLRRLEAGKEHLRQRALWASGRAVREAIASGRLSADEGAQLHAAVDAHPEGAWSGYLALEAILATPVPRSVPRSSHPYEH